MAYRSIEAEVCRHSQEHPESHTSGDATADARSARADGAVEAETDITNGYLSQIENGLILKPSPNVLYELAALYGLDYTDLLTRAGHRVPRAEAERPDELNGIPLRALAELTVEERADLMSYLAFIKSKR